MICQFFEVDLSVFEIRTEPKLYDLNLAIKKTDMNQLTIDIKTLLSNNWKIILLFGIIIYIVSNYTDIKSGLLDF